MKRKNSINGMKSIILFLIKFCLAIIIILALLLLVMEWAGVSCIKKIDQSLPSWEDAPQEVRTVFQLYYAEDISDIKKDDRGKIVSLVMTGWYERANDTWTYHPEPVPLNSRIHGEITVRQRPRPLPSSGR